MAEPEPTPTPLCPSAALAEGGLAHVWDVLEYGRPARAFALRFDGQVRAYLNRCLHVPVEMDWQPGQFLDSEQRFIVCSIHGASYRPQDGRCVGGPCGRGSLKALQVAEAGGQVHWYPSRNIQPAPAAAPLHPAPHPGNATGAADESPHDPP
jgi:nitrite reductase/ring-hydroxylating ferredoxin subunit